MSLGFRFVFIIFSVLVLLPQDAFPASGRTIYAHLYGNGQSYIKVRFSTNEVKQINRDIDIDAEKSRSPIEVLGAYYYYGSRAKYEQMSSLYDINDGSRDRFLKGLRDWPDKYKGYKNVVGLKITQIVKNNMRVVVNYVQNSKNNGSISLARQLNCYEINSCWLVYDTSQVWNSPFATLTNMISGLDKNQFSTSFSGSDYTSIAINPFDIFVKLEKKNKRFSLLEEYDGQDKVVAAFSKFLHQIRLLGQEGYEGVVESISQLMEQNDKFGITVIETAKNDKIEAHEYRPYAFWQLVSGWSEIHVVGYIKQGKKGFLVYSVEQEDLGPLQVIPFISEDNLRVIFKPRVDEKIWSLLKDPVFLEKLAKTELNK